MPHIYIYSRGSRGISYTLLDEAKAVEFERTASWRLLYLSASVERPEAGQELAEGGGKERDSNRNSDIRRGGR